LDLQISPSVAADACLIENENINFRFRFWDVDQQVEITYPDFLAHTAFRYEIHNQVKQVVSKDPKQLHFTKAFATGSSGQYTALSSWNYNLDKLKNQEPPLSLVKEFCVAEDGRLVHLSYDTTQTWQGRRLVLQAKVDRTDATFLQEVTTIYVQTGQGQVLLQQTAPNTNSYEGSIDRVAAKLYQLTIENRYPKYKLGFDEHTATQFEGRARYLVYEIEQRAYAAAKQQLSWKDKLYQALESLKGAKHYERVRHSYKGDQDILVTSELPFAEALDEEIPISIRLNKRFPDEQVQFNFKVKANAYAQADVRTGGWWGLLQSSSAIPDAIKTDFLLKGSQSLEQSSMLQYLRLQKIAGDIFLEQPLQPMPSMEVQVAIDIAIPGYPRQLTIASKTLAFAITTSHWSRFWVQAERIGKWILLSLLVLISLSRRFLCFIS